MLALKRFAIAAIAGVLGVAVLAALTYARMNAFMDAPAAQHGDIDFAIDAGTPFGAVADKLESDGVITSADWFRTFARWSGDAGQVQAGEYRIPAGSTPREILKQFTSGAVQLYSFTIIEGWNQWDLLQALHDDPYLTASLTDEDWPALLQEFGATTTHPEGMFLPETYRFPRATTDRELLRQAYDLMQRTLAEEWAAKSDETMVKTPYEAQILASIIEKETARVDERERISGVFTRRLQKRMRLQTDPTVIYGIGKEFNGNLTRKDLRTPTPYNTYTNHGLPPTPIAMPGRAAIRAALHPADGDELFFVATGLGDGSHKFSATKEEHDEAVAEYLKRLRSRRSSGS